MPEAWTAREERPYTRVKQTGINRSRYEEPTRELANMVREQAPYESRTGDRRALGTGNPRAPLEERSRDELYNLAEANDIKGRSRMNKTQLIAAIRRRVGSDL